PNPTDDEPFAYDVPVGTRTIGEGAFNSSALERVSLPSTLRMVRDRAFQWNYHLADIQISEGLERIGDRAFYCPATSITLPSTLTHLGDNALDLDGFEGLVLPERLKKVGSFVFHSFNGTFSTGSDTLHIGRKLSSIGQDTFDSLAITAFDVDPANKTFASVDGLLTTKDGKTLLRCPAGLNGELRIPEGIEHLEPGCLDVATGVTDVYFPASAVGVDAYHDFSDGSAARQVTFHCASGSAAALYAREHDIPWTEEGI
ncbi:MAG: leucine-rich repeat domain-containing protein, partial [Atopobiaceae bacterium]|nr:leucine-rich repeat domain-containing protein [Atopobiaceae bacterium]